MSQSARPSAMPKAISENPLKEFARFGQSVWLADVSAGLAKVDQAVRQAPA